MDRYKSNRSLIYPANSFSMQKQACGIVGGFMEDIFGKELKPWQENEKPETEL